jgi:hypothetical protein
VPFVLLFSTPKLYFWTGSKSMKKALVFLLLSISATGVYAQVDLGQLSGTVTDSTGAVLPNASVHIHSDATGLDRTMMTDGAGSYIFGSIPNGTYTETITSTGFETFNTKVVVNVGGKATIDAKLQTGTSSTVIEVAATDEASQVNTTSSEISTVITPRQVMDLPSLTRNPYDFVELSGNAGSDPNGSTGRGVGFSLSGQRAAGTEILLDGVENADNYDAEVGQTIPLDAVEEYRIITNGFDAQYGRASGGVVNLVTKGGSNKFHGSAYEYNRVSDLAANTYNEDAQNYANRAAGLPNNPADHFTRNQFGFSVGGPVLRDRLFFYSNFEWNRIRSIGSKIYEIPTPAFIAASSATTQTFFSNFGTIAPSTRIGQTVAVDGYTGANPLELATVSAPIDAGAGAPLNQWDAVNRIDYTVSQKMSMFFRAGSFKDTYQAGYNSLSPYAGYNTGQNDFDQSYLYGLNYTFTPLLLSTSKVSFSRLNTLQPLNGTALIPGLYLNQANTASTDNGTGNVIALPGYLPTSPGGALPFGGPANTYQFLQNINYTIKAHTLNFGGEFFQLRDNRTFGAYDNAVQLVAKSGTGLSTALNALAAGDAYSYEVAINPQGHLPCAYNQDGSLNATAACSITLPATSPSFVRENTFNDGSWYAEDSWKVSPRLVLDYGIRWEYYGVQHNHDPNLESNYFLGSGDNIAEQVASGQILTTPNSPYGGVTKKNLKNYAPRIGFAYDPLGNGKWSVRGGFGISYERNFGNVTYNIIQNPPNYAGVTLTSSATNQYMISTTNFGPFAGSGGTVGLPAPSLRALAQTMPTAYTEQYLFSVEHEIAPGDLLAIEYSGARGVHQYSIADVNGVGYGTFLGDEVTSDYANDRLNHQYGAINIREANGDSHYDGVNVRLNASNLAHYGLQMTMNYTLSHALDNLSSTFSESANNFNLGYLNPFNPKLDYGNADYDTRHRLTIGGLYEPSFLEFKSNRILHATFGGLEFAPIAQLSSGTPFTIYDCTNGLNACPRIVAAPGLKYRGTPTPNGGINSYDYIAIPATSDNPFVNSQGFSDFPDTLGGYQNSGLGRNQWFGPHNYTFDLGTYKNFHFGKTERYTAQLRGEFYNVLNHHNFYPVVGDADYAEETTVEAIKGSPGGSSSSGDERRNVQIALRLQF